MFRILLAALLALCPAVAHARPSTPSEARFSVIVEGSGPDVILIPGLSTPRDVWDGVRTSLRRHYRLHLIQLRGFGEPAGPNAEGPVLEPFVEALAAYIRQQHLRRPAIVGHSLGGLSALMLGARHPALPGRIMVVDAVPSSAPCSRRTPPSPRSRRRQRRCATRFSPKRDRSGPPLTRPRRTALRRAPTPAPAA